jgi:hypothetical protein
VAGSGRYTAFGFANPTRRVLTAVLHTRTEVRRIAPPGSVTGTGPAGDLPDSSAATDGADAVAPHVGYASDVIEVVEQYLYRPLLRPLAAAGRAARRLQSGRLDAYLAYMLIALVAVLAVVTALA